MHEYSIVSALLDQVEAQARRHPEALVLCIRVRVGELSGVDGELLRTAWSLARKVARRMGCKTIGGVLITRIRPGHKVDWHVDGGWHANHYRKFGLQIHGNQDQAFRFEDCELRAEPGELYEFINQRPHMVANDSDSDRITMIVCAR